MMKVVILRPEPGASATAKRAQELGLQTIALPLFEIFPVAWDAPDAAQFDAILLTSANAVRQGGAAIDEFTGLTAYCVGPATAEAAREAGFTVASTGEGGVGELLRSLPAGFRLFHPRGRIHMPVNLPRLKITPATVYHSKPRESVPELGQLAGSLVLVHSPRAGERLAELVDEAGLDRSTVTIAAISPAAQRAAGKGWKATHYSLEPRDRALLALAAELCDKIASE